MRHTGEAKRRARLTRRRSFGRPAKLACRVHVAGLMQIRQGKALVKSPGQASQLGLKRERDLKPRASKKTRKTKRQSRSATAETLCVPEFFIQPHSTVGATARWCMRLLNGSITAVKMLKEKKSD